MSGFGNEKKFGDLPSNGKREGSKQPKRTPYSEKQVGYLVFQVAGPFRIGTRQAFQQIETCCASAAKMQNVFLSENIMHRTVCTQTMIEYG